MTAAVFVLLIALAMAASLWGGRGGAHQKPEDFFVASGRFGSLLFFVLAVGETYSIATILGVPSGVYAHGTGFLAWFLGYILLAFPVGYFLYPAIWRAGRRHGAVTLPDLFGRHFRSRALERIVALNCIAFLLPLGVLQFVGLGTVLAALHLTAPPLALLGIAGALVFAMVAVSGIRGPAQVAVLKDALMLLAVVATGGAAIAWASGQGGGPAHAASPPPPAAAAWPVDIFAMSTIVLQAIGFCLVPQTVAAVFTARSAATLRRAQCAMPLYMLMFPLLVAIATVARHLPSAPSDANAVFVTLAGALLPPWAFGLVLAGATLSALVVLAGICLALGPLVARNILPGLDGDAQRRAAKMVMALYLLASIWGAARFHGLMVSINNLFYFGITQTFPGLVALLAGWRVRASAIVIALLAGDALAIWLYEAAIGLGGVNPGLVGLGLNAAILGLLSRLWPARSPP